MAKLRIFQFYKNAKHSFVSELIDSLMTCSVFHCLNKFKSFRPLWCVICFIHVTNTFAIFLLAYSTKSCGWLCLRLPWIIFTSFFISHKVFTIWLHNFIPLSEWRNVYASKAVKISIHDMLLHNGKVVILQAILDALK